MSTTNAVGQMATKDHIGELQAELADERAKVAVAVEALEKYANKRSWHAVNSGKEHSFWPDFFWSTDRFGLKAGYVFAQEALTAMQSTDALAENPATPSLDQLIEWARNYKWTDEDRKRFVRSFAYGNIKMHNPNVTREMVDAEADKLDLADLRRKVARECAKFVDEAEILMPIEDWMGTKKEFGKKLAHAIADAIRAKFGTTKATEPQGTEVKEQEPIDMPGGDFTDVLHQKIDRLDAELAAERAKTALAVSTIEGKLDDLIDAVTEDKLVLYSTPNGQPHDPDPLIGSIRGEILTALQSDDAPADIRRDVARKCAEIVKSQEIVWIGKHFPEEDTEATLNAAADAIRAKFRVTESTKENN
jgi:flagellar hook-basal body complex protein FliE